jgi:hypothetical protein
MISFHATTTLIVDAIASRLRMTSVVTDLLRGLNLRDLLSQALRATVLSLCSFPPLHLRKRIKRDLRFQDPCHLGTNLSGKLAMLILRLLEEPMSFQGSRYRYRSVTPLGATSLAPKNRRLRYLSPKTLLATLHTVTSMGLPFA